MIDKLIKEYGLEIDDIRWYLSHLLSLKLLSHAKKPDEIQKMIWSGELESELYNMEENYLEKLQDEYSRDVLDEAHVRDIFSEISNMKRKRKLR